MASSKEYLNYILEQLSGLDEITYRQMMGEFILYYRGKIIGGIYDDRLLVKPVNRLFPICRQLFMKSLMTVQRICCWFMRLIVRIF